MIFIHQSKYQNRRVVPCAGETCLNRTKGTTGGDILLSLPLRVRSCVEVLPSVLVEWINRHVVRIRANWYIISRLWTFRAFIKYILLISFVVTIILCLFGFSIFTRIYYYYYLLSFFVFSFGLTQLPALLLPKTIISCALSEN